MFIINLITAVVIYNAVATTIINLFRFNMITMVVICLALVVGILIPDIELVLGIVGSTMGQLTLVMQIRVRSLSADGFITHFF